MAEPTPEEKLRSDAEFAAVEADRADEAVTRAQGRLAKATEEVAQIEAALDAAKYDADAKRVIANDLAAQVAALPPVDPAPVEDSGAGGAGAALNASVRIS